MVLSDKLSLNHLLYADDMAILSLSSEGLQHSLVNLHEYCKVWYLEVGIQKTKVIVFDSSGRVLKPFQFVYDGKPIEIVKEFKYLGTTLSPSVSLFLTKEKLRKQANKVYFPIISALQIIDFDAVTSLKLFDSLIKPILTYKCEFWSQLTKSKIEAIKSKKISLEESYFDAPDEKLHQLFCRNTLGVSNKTSSLATLGELDRYPVMLNCYVQMIKYWHHIKTAYSKNSLVYKVISYIENNDKQEQYKWL